MKLVIGSKGVMTSDLSEITLMGASTKRDDASKIGKFGTGNKYAIAYLLRNNYGMQVVSGGRKIEFTTEPVKLRDHEFNVILIDGVRTGFTTELGYKWKLWQAIRELYSNAVDEGLLIFDLVLDEPEYQDDATYFIIDGNDGIQDLWINIHNYFLIDERPLFTCKFGEIYAKRGTQCRIFNNGIRCLDTEKSSVFDYNFFDIDLTEDRIAMYRWEPVRMIHKVLACCDNPAIIRNALAGMGDEQNFECEVDSIFMSTVDYQDAWKDELQKQPAMATDWAGYLNEDERFKTYLVPKAIYKMLVSQFGEMVKPKSVKFSSVGDAFRLHEMTDQEAIFLEQALSFLDGRYKLNYPVKIVSFHDKRVLGSVDEDTILISDVCLNKGLDVLLQALIEEQIHIKYGVADETRAFQDAAIQEWVNYMKGH